ncbi:hypothetical protein V7S43_012219 [Phytophthora oleae]|uniref:Uncharacterized protein n=1 Tax=Phytophthora oleae TaxID=2107226 RepID=A0ABD3F7W2_9STRA
MTSGTLSYTFFNFEEHEIVMLTRGRRCSKGSCTTAFVDDYRYERNILQTNVEDWYLAIATVRAGAQGHTAFVSTKTFRGQRRLWYSRVASAIATVFKIPFQVIVYSSLVPVVGYVVALLLDGNFMDIYLDSYWSTLEGASNFELLSFLKSAVTQMRTVWLMALLVDLMVLVTRKSINGSEEKIPGIRGLAISFTSALTIIGPYRQTAFRSASIVQTIVLPAVGQRVDAVQSVPQWFFNESTYMFDDSMTMLGFCVMVVAVLASATRLMSFCGRADRGLVLISTLNVPYCTEFFWPTSSLSVRFNALSSSTPYLPPLRPSAVRISPEPQYLPPTAPRASYFNVTKVAPSHEPVAIGPPTGGLCSRTTESHSILQLMNIAMMTDPWNFLCSSGLLYYAVILPYAEDETEERTGLSCDDFQLLDCASSRYLPMEVVLQSG